MYTLDSNHEKISIKEDFIVFPFYIISRPFKGFSDLKYENRGKTYFAFIMMILLCLFAICDEMYKGFVVLGYHRESRIIDTFYVILMTLVPIILFVVANWCVTTISDGNATVKEIFMVYAYASYPQLLLNIIGLILSNIVTMNEAAFSTFFYVFGVVAFIFYLFVGLITVHEYLYFKDALKMAILTILAMCIIVFIAALFITLLNEVIVFISTVIKEISLNLQ